MTRKTTKNLIYLFGYIVVIYPLFIRYKNLGWDILGNFPNNLFPAFGLIAFSILWLHSISGVFEPWLRDRINFDRYVQTSSIIVLISIILHPLLILMSLDFNLSRLYLYGETYIKLGIIAWLLLITYDIGKLLKRYDFFVRHWRKILLISTIGFLLTFFHSLNLGSDLQSGPLRAIWIFYGVTGIISTIYTYVIKSLTKR